MENKYKLVINDYQYWKAIYKDKKKYYEKTNRPCHIYVEKTNPFVENKMICNYKDISGINYIWTRNQLGVRLREHNDFIIIEPSGIMVPKEDFILITSDKEIEKGKDKYTNIGDITQTNYFCNLISDTTRGGKDCISFKEVSEYREHLIYQPSGPYNPSFLTPFEFAYMFITTCYKKNITSFNTYNLLNKIIEKYNSNPEYMPLLWNINYTCSEHYDDSESLFNAFALLRYIGLIYPNYDSDCQYEELIIDSNIDKYPNLIMGKEEYLPLIDQFVNEHFELSDNKGISHKNIKHIKVLLATSNKKRRN